MFSSRAELKTPQKSEEVLEISQSTRSRWGQMLADVIFSDQLAEAIAEIEAPRNSKIDANMRSEHRSRGGKRRGRQLRRSTRADEMFGLAPQMGDAGSGAKIRPDPTAPPAKIEEEINDTHLL